MSKRQERAACQPLAVDPHGFNLDAKLPYGLTTEHIRLAMIDFIQFLALVNRRLHGKGIQRLETMLMPANFSSVVGEFMIAGIPKYCPTLVKNRHHNGHPDLLPAGRFANDAAQHADQGIEVKGSRYLKGWQGHNPEDTWLMVFAFDSNRPGDDLKGIEPGPFQFVRVVGARLTKKDWLFAGRSETSRRTITASVTGTGYQKMMANWIYRVPESRDRE